MSTYTVAGSPIQSLTLRLPRYGIWTARCKLAGTLALAVGAPVAIALGDLTIAGTVRAGGVFASSAEYVIVGGKDKWSGPVRRRVYRSDGGVKLSQVAVDLGADVGEPVALLDGVDRVLGYAWPRAATDTASEALAALATPWHVAPNGTTYLGARIETALPKATKWTLESYDPANRIAVCGVSADQLAGFRPGVRLASSGMDIVVGSVVMTVTDRKTSIKAWGV